MQKMQDVQTWYDPVLQNIYSSFFREELLPDTGAQNPICGLAAVAAHIGSGAHACMRECVATALEMGARPTMILETAYHCAPYVGFPAVLDALDEIHGALSAFDVDVCIEACPNAGYADRIRRGRRIQFEIFGSSTVDYNKAFPDDQARIRDYMSGLCFGDFYGRSELDLKQREILTLCVLCALGGCDDKLRTHVRGNLNVGNTRKDMISAVLFCLPLIGFPRTLSALACIDQEARSMY